MLLFANMITGTLGQDFLEGTEDNDKITALDGNDIIEASPGADSINGGDGIDTVDYKYSDDWVKVDLQKQKGERGDAEGDRYISIENVIGSDYDDAIYGDEESNRFDGGDGDDLMSGRGGDDVFEGGYGFDRYDGGQGVDTVDYMKSSEGISVDLIKRLGSFGDAEGDVLIDIENVFGTDFHDRIKGNKKNNYLRGYMSKDYLFGMEGDDSIEGGDGPDVMDGGDGTDTLEYRLSQKGVIVDLIKGRGKRGDAEGDVFSNFENIFGSIYNDTLIGDTQSNRINGSMGNDVLDGRGGADILNGALGVDTVSYRYSPQAVLVNLETGKGYFGDAQGDQIIDVENVFGSQFSDVLIGSESNNNIRTGAGDDYILMSQGQNRINFEFSLLGNEETKVLCDETEKSRLLVVHNDNRNTAIKRLFLFGHSEEKLSFYDVKKRVMHKVNLSNGYQSIQCDNIIYEIYSFQSSQLGKLNNIKNTDVVGITDKPSDNKNFSQFKNIQKQVIAISHHTLNPQIFDFSQLKSRSNNIFYADVNKAGFASFFDHSPSFFMTKDTIVKSITATDYDNVIILNSEDNVLNTGSKNSFVVISDQSIHSKTMVKGDLKLEGQSKVVNGWGQDICYSDGALTHYYFDVQQAKDLIFHQKGQNLVVDYNTEMNGKNISSSLTITNYQKEKVIFVLGVDSKEENKVVESKFSSYINSPHSLKMMFRHHKKTEELLKTYQKKSIVNGQNPVGLYNHVAFSI